MPSQTTKIVTITGISGSGKTTLTEKILSDFGLRRCINMTTRKRRGDGDNDYRFLSEGEFLEEVRSGNLIEHVFYDGNFYGIPIPTFPTVIILEPCGLSQAQKYCATNNVPIFSIFLDASEETSRIRMLRRGDASEKVEKRISLDRYFDIVGKPLCNTVIDANGDEDQVYDQIRSAIIRNRIFS